ncbi:MAG: hypothetical protein HY909_22075 [Deltaproteobacteria bacterium]|nr:hypothetical protein [Deltaproteobacteria bacterium]
MDRRIFLFALLSIACTNGPSAPPGDASPQDLGDAALDAADTVTDGQDGALPLDTGDAPATDAGPVEVAPYTCMPCNYDFECGEGGSCTEVDPMGAPRLRGCAIPCETVGEACAGGVASRCTATRLGGPVCMPTAGCIPMESRRGSPCPATGCTGRYNRCALVPGREALCVPPCNRDSDCENGWQRCRVLPLRGGGTLRACVPDDPVGPEGCGLVGAANGVGQRCGDGASCPSGMECIPPADPAITRSFCTRACADDAACGEGSRCLELGARGRRCVPLDCECVAGARETLLDRALSQATWTRCNLYFSGANLNAFPPEVTRDRFRLPVFDRVHRDWLTGLRWSRDLGPTLDRTVTSLGSALSAAAELRADGRVRGRPLPSPPAMPEGASPLVDATAALGEHFGSSIDRAAAERDAEDVPVGLQRALARIIVAIDRAAQARDRGLRFATEPSDRALLWRVAPHIVLATGRSDLRPSFNDALFLGSLLGDVELPVDEALGLAATIEGTDWATFRGMTGVSYNVDTALGRIVVRDGASHRYDVVGYDETVLVVDLGGDDTYEAPVAANASPDNRVSVLVDLGGSDTYGYAVQRDPLDIEAVLPSDGGGRARSGTAGSGLSLSEVGRQGSARLGVALLYDLGGGRDRYRSLRMSQGFGALGVGGLYDDGGDDEYDVEAGGQGAGINGLGVLVDAGGSDRYRAWAFSQAFAYVKGVGLLYDRDGDDVWNSVVTPVLYPSPQTMGSNSSFTQGAGFGRRADGTADRINMSGGLAVLRDRAGNDRYTTGVFGQGTGYWGGMGLLLDGAGDDRYDGRWYVQGGIAHFAYGALVDGGGRDVHNTMTERQNMTAGAGHDFSLGIFLALGPESDEYHVPNLALGAGNANGAGIFVEEGGDDRYTAASSLTLGNAALETLMDPGRLMRPTVGLFLDAAGNDTYTRPTVTPVRNDGAWSQRIHAEAMSETGMGADGTGLPLGL